MGRAIEAAAIARGHEVVLRVGSVNAGSPPTGADVAIEFSRPELAVENIALCVRHGVPVVVGTTGWYDRLSEVKALVAAERGSVLWASNFSIGVNLFFRLNKYLTQLMDPQAAYTARLDEIHHIHKLDAPSGTAITLARDLDLSSQRYTGWVLDPDTPPATQGPLPIHSERIGAVPGTHSITWQSPEDRITITHEAFGRQGFATGAVVAAGWMTAAGGRTGLFTMDDVLRG